MRNYFIFSLFVANCIVYNIPFRVQLVLEWVRVRAQAPSFQRYKAIVANDKKRLKKLI